MLQNLDTVIAFAMIMLMLSLIITVLVQAVVAALELRGNNLIASLAKVLLQVEPSLRNNPAIAKEIATKVAEHPSLVHFSSAQGRVGTFLAKFFTRPVKGIEAKEWIRLLDELGNDPNNGLGNDAKDALNQLLAAEVPGATPERMEQAKKIAAQLSAAFPFQTQMVEQGIQKALGSTRKIVAGTGKWFDAVMDRSSDWFTTQTRVWTVILAIGLAFVFKVDSLLIIRQLADNPEARAKLVQSTNDVLDKTKKDMETTSAADIALTTMAAEYHKNGDAREGILNAVPQSPTLSCGVAATAISPQPNDPVRTEFTSRCKEEDAQSLQAAAQKLKDYAAQVDNSQLTIISLPLSPQNPMPWLANSMTWAASLRKNSQPAKNGDSAKATSSKQDSATQVNQGAMPGYAGSLITGLLLTLGAPFWFNTLRDLSNLRPAISDKLDDISAVDSLMSAVHLPTASAPQPAAAAAAAAADSTAGGR